MLKVNDVYNMINALAPYETQASFDNSGLNVGNGENKVTGILVALDTTENVVDEAIELGTELIVCHHPLMFNARKNMTEHDPEGRILCKLIRHHISVISAHTNLDLTEYSGSACIARALSLDNIHSDEYLYIGDLKESCNAAVLNEKLNKILGVDVRIYGSKEKRIGTVAIAGGAFDSGFRQAICNGADCLITGEVRHHNALTASMENFVLYDGTHYATEAILVEHLADTLQKCEQVVK